MDDPQLLRHIAYWANQGRDLMKMLQDAGFNCASRTQRTTFENDPTRVVTVKRAGEKRNWTAYREIFVYRDGELRAIFHAFEDEAFLFLWTGEARAPRWRQALWQLRQPWTFPPPLPA